MTCLRHSLFLKRRLFNRLARQIPLALYPNATSQLEQSFGFGFVSSSFPGKQP
jgi:hypothetical protein